MDLCSWRRLLSRDAADRLSVWGGGNAHERGRFYTSSVNFNSILPEKYAMQEKHFASLTHFRVPVYAAPAVHVVPGWKIGLFMTTAVQL